MDNRKMIYLDDVIDAVWNLDVELRPSAIDAILNMLNGLPSEQRTVKSEVVMCKDCIHRPIIDDQDAKDGFGLLFPDFRCPCRCDDPYYSWMPNDNWFCGNGEKKKGE